MRNLKGGLASLVVFAASCGAAAQSTTLPSIYGLQLGAPLGLEECDGRMFLGRWQYDTVNIKRVVCYQRGYGASRDAPVVDGQVYVKWPLSSGGPEISKNNGASVRLVGGLVQRIEIETLGVRVQDVAFDQLLQKFGQPTSTKAVPMQNRMGAKFDAIHADWKVGDATISLLGIGLSLDSGYLIAETPQGRDAHKAANDKLYGDKPKL